MVAASASQTEKAPVVLVPGTGTGPARPSAPLNAVTKVLAPSALPAVFGMTAQLDALVTSLMITVSERPPETSRGSDELEVLDLGVEVAARQVDQQCRGIGRNTASASAP